MNRSIVAFFEDSDSEWVVELACGHRRHVRHAPPFSERPWVLTPESREGRIGSDLDCIPCDRSEIPTGYEPYRQTPHFDEDSVPDALLGKHSTKRGVWARIHILRGALDYHLHAPFDRCERLTPSTPGVVLPEVEHHIAPAGPVAFFVEFWRPAKAAG